MLGERVPQRIGVRGRARPTVSLHAELPEGREPTDEVHTHNL